MKKICVFCGRKPSSKSKEHVVPEWLIELTGNPKREFYLGFDLRKKDRPLRRFAAKSLHFPACDKCNNKSSELESRAQDIMGKILGNLPVDAYEIDVFLDWFDKVRIGLWLGRRYLDGDYWGVEPVFHIQTRVGVSDRMLGIYACEGGQRDLTFCGIGSPGFSFMPSCFLLKVNQVLFFNVSAEFLVSRRIGLPYPKQIMRTDKSGVVGLLMKPARKRVMKPIIRRNLRPAEVFLHQPVVREGLRGEFPQLYEDTYVKEHMLVERQGKGNILVERSDDMHWLRGELRLMQERPGARREIAKQLLGHLAVQTLEFQTYLNKDYYSLCLLSSADRRRTKGILFGIEKAHNIMIRTAKRWATGQDSRGGPAKSQRHIAPQSPFAPSD